MLQELLSNEKLKKQANRISLKTNPLVWHFRKLSFLSRFKINEYVRNTGYLTSDDESVSNKWKENKTKTNQNKSESGDYLVLDEFLDNEFTNISKNSKDNKLKNSNISPRKKSKRKQQSRDSNRDFAKFIIDELEKLPESIAKDCQQRIKIIINEYTNNLL